ncbi:RNA-binding protein [Paenibacillus swuensis]|uniref:RNA-binding protein n=1 Tax=Paenibacillus swuensis TaxID=1178515 RepID=A0A172TII5_9BACL|nr:NYN domain-containing protein [Paenibacillus swuensis]ANE46766.1 RNA-binding protein [Paenibacillus swuensis]
MREMEEYLVVDGYNMIGSWPELIKQKQISLESARDRLIEMLSEYQSFTGMKVIVVFDAYLVPGTGSELTQSKVAVQFTREKETADEVIERLMSELTKRRRQIYVATSDWIEQHVTFGKGALRLSARELLSDIEDSKREIHVQLKEQQTHSSRNTLDNKLSRDMKLLFERWRRQ